MVKNTSDIIMKILIHRIGVWNNLWSPPGFLGRKKITEVPLPPQIPNRCVTDGSATFPHPIRGIRRVKLTFFSMIMFLVWIRIISWHHILTGCSLRSNSYFRWVYDKLAQVNSALTRTKCSVSCSCTAKLALSAQHLQFNVFVFPWNQCLCVS